MPPQLNRNGSVVGPRNTSEVTRSIGPAAPRRGARVISSSNTTSRLQAGQSRSQAEVHTVTEREVLGRVSPGVEDGGSVEHALVAVRRAEQREHGRAARDRRARDLGFARSRPEHDLHRGVVAQGLLDDRSDARAGRHAPHRATQGRRRGGSWRCRCRYAVADAAGRIRTSSWPGSARRGAVRPASSDTRAATARRAARSRGRAPTSSSSGSSDCGSAGICLPRVAVGGDAGRHGRDRLLVGLDRVELVPAERRRHLRARAGAHAPRAEHRLVRRVLVEVDEDALAALLLPPRVGDASGCRRAQLARERERRGRAPRYESHWGSSRTYTWMPRLPVVFGSATMPSSSSNAFTSCAATRASSNVVPGCGSRSMRSSSACSGSSASDGHTWKPRHPRFTAHAMCARSSATSARDVVPFGVLTIGRAQPRRRVVGHALLEERVAARAVREALHQHGPSAHRAHDRLGDREVVVDEVELGLAPLLEEHLARARDADVVAVDLELDRVVLLGHAGTVVAARLVVWCPAMAFVVRRRRWAIRDPRSRCRRRPVRGPEQLRRSSPDDRRVEATAPGASTIRRREDPARAASLVRRASDTTALNDASVSFAQLRAGEQLPPAIVDELRRALPHRRGAIPTRSMARSSGSASTTRHEVARCAISSAWPIVCPSAGDRRDRRSRGSVEAGAVTPSSRASPTRVDVDSRRCHAARRCDARSAAPPNASRTTPSRGRRSTSTSTSSWRPTTSTESCG